jgi:RNA polymerase sigma-70 factor (ECF subfamily)
MDLLERFAAGDLEAFESLFRQYQGEVYRWIMRIVRNSATAEDLTVETFWRMYRARAQFDLSKGNCGPWLRRIATNAALDHLRRSHREVPLPDDVPAAAKQPPAEQLELRREILAAIDKLSPPLRAVILLALLEEESHENIAQALSISENAVRVRLFRGVRILRKSLSQAGVHA